MKAKIKLDFRIVIDQNSDYVWDKYVFDATFLEYKIQHQVFDNPVNPTKNFWELLKKNKNAKKIPFILNASIANYISQLDGIIQSLPDVLGTTFFPIESFMLDIVSANIEDPTKHKIGITFYSPELLLLDIIDQKYLLSKDLTADNGFQTFMFPFHPQVSISYYEYIK